MIDLIVIPICLIVGFVIWYLFYGLECWANGAFMSSKQTHWSCLLEDVLWVLPGASKRKGEYIKKTMGSFEHGSMCSSSGSWDYEEIREKNLYEVVGNAMLPGLGHFLFMHVLIPFGPLFLYLSIKLIAAQQ